MSMGEKVRGGIRVISKTYNVDCMEYMKTLPDNAFDLAVVDPPYGDGSQSVNAERGRVQPLRRMVEPIQRGTTDSASGSTSTRIQRGGYHGKDKYHMGQPGPGEPGPASTAKKL
jgi:hypothetical protein